ncbi:MULTISPECIES: Tol-Pal system beta propeller repeat protein TolB [Mameliella]|uniref:Tol-Pal system protein TolB n=1 Tax=Mameliella alba TaxID=561184 RepID=A0A0B3SQ99_9RHOB|nr:MULTISPECIES: Tol-Pal system beta propeller repeat protein TolB [Mameliella]MCR9273849.1 Tol-Pal system beta propeller repeat protein TolB [Paracoccaceae bacterium]ODM50367.1 Tol-Pal system beta propeller repeat protein TolB [Ruegeria sp. PBVC088]KHQ52594.1 Translocation protein TolB [Mameliella alba]MBY6118054.1 Tol-Pal system beta propeller repeat protein TolB [Mameliella alba]MDD9729040.1 Tol-Pal system beta propeller repeat protein TolB [Mameliella sp. AT18]
MIARLAALVLACATAFLPVAVQAQSGPLRIEITEGVIEPLPYAVPDFVAETQAAEQFAAEISRVVAADLTGTGLFREIPRDAHIARVSSFGAPVQFADWKAINAQALITGSVSADASGRVVVKFRVWDVFAGQELGQGMQFASDASGWRRLAHKVADQVYSRLTGETPYFDSRVVFVSETGPKDARQKRLAIMDYDGANVQYLTDDSSLVLAPRFSPNGGRVLYTSYETGFPRIHVLTVGDVASQILQVGEGVMSFAPRFSPDGRMVVYSLTQGSNTDIFAMDLASGATRRLTSAPSIETAPSFSPDGQRIVFESDRSGTQQLYVMPAMGGEAQRISFGDGRYGTPVWSPRGDRIAFTKQNAGRFHIGVMRTDGGEERLLTASFLDEGPTWAPNGRVIMFSRETQGAQGSSALYSVDISGRNLKRVRTPAGASDPSWGPLQ